jgi:hypothetical protein
MSYVPGLLHDVFLSYARQDRNEWLKSFEIALVESITQELGHPVVLWQDVRSLRFGSAWSDEINAALRSTAAFVAMLTPSYRNADWCTREANAFRAQFKDEEEMRAGGIMRLLKIVRRPWENFSHDQFFGAAQALEFHAASDAARLELVPGSEVFKQRIAQAAGSIVALLRALRRKRQRVYVASPPDDLIEPWKDLKLELHKTGFDVRPEGLRRPPYEDDFLADEMKGSVLAVHLLGARYDAFAVEQIELAAELGIQSLFWVSKETREQADEGQSRLLDELEKSRTPGGNALPGKLLLLRGPLRRMTQDVLASLDGLPSSAAPAPVARGSVYLLCDQTSGEDLAFAGELRSQILQREGSLQVSVPDAEVRSALAARQRHEERVRACDGLLVLRKAAPEEWLLHQLPYLIHGERLLKRPPMRSKALLVDDPGEVEGQPQSVRVIARTAAFSVADLEPFLAPLRSAEGTHAGA